MDSYREHPNDFEGSSSADEPTANDVTAAIGTDERRMHVRAYNYWVSLLDGRDFPAIDDLDPTDVEDFSSHSVLLDFTCGRDNPAIPYVGAAIRDECGLDDDMRTIADVPSRSLLSRLTDHYLQIIANRAPIGFEAEYENVVGETICYRGILMPFSSDGEQIDFIYGVINWKRVGSALEDAAGGDVPVTEIAHLQTEEDAPDAPEAVEFAEGDLEIGAAGEPETAEFADEPQPEATDEPETAEFADDEPQPEATDKPETAEFADDEPQPEATDEPETVEFADDEPEVQPMDEPETVAFAELEIADDEPFELTEIVALAADEPEFAELPEPDTDPEPISATEAAPAHFSWEDGPLHDDEEHGIELPDFALDENAGLADRLWAARETAESVKAGEGRTRAALYKALSLAYDFALAAEANAEEYIELLEESGVKAQARAPMTPIVKLVFGIDYDKARLTEFAAALSYAHRQQVEAGGFQDLIEKQPGGLKALVAAERKARRPEPNSDTKAELGRARLRSAPVLSLADVPAHEEFAVVITRRSADGHHEPVAIVDDEALVERAIRRVA